MAHRTPTQQKPWVHEMVLAHRVFRSELALLPAMVSGTALGDQRRARTLGRHYRFVTQVLHDHHTFEDEHFWPTLLTRCPLDGELVERMERQHEGIDTLLRNLELSWRAWEQRADAANRASLAAKLAALSSALEEHLHDEEVFLLPLMADYLTVPEWEAFGAYAGKKIDKRFALFWLGLTFALMDEQERARFWGKLPVPARAVYRLFGARAYRRGVARTRGTA